MRILTLCYEFPPVGGGGAKVVAGLCRELVSLGHEIDIVTMGFSNCPSIEDYSGAKVYRTKSTRKRRDICHTHEMIPYLISALPLVLRLVAERKYDLNHTHFVFPDGVLSWLVRLFTGLPYVVTAHGSDVPGYNPDRFQMQHYMLSPLWKLVVRNAECIICPSAHLQELLFKSSKNAKTEIIPNGMHAGKFNPARSKRMRVLVVTRMLERKGVQDLLQALDGANFGYEVNIVGDGPYLDTLKSMAENISANIRFRGWLDNESSELKELYETSQIYVFTSQQENFPVNLLEAMAAGMAIVVSTDPGSREVVGDAAVIVPTGQPAELFAALDKLTRDPALCDELGRRARQRLESLFTWPNVANLYDKLFKRVIG